MQLVVLAGDACCKESSTAVQSGDVVSSAATRPAFQLGGSLFFLQLHPCCEPANEAPPGCNEELRRRCNEAPLAAGSDATQRSSALPGAAMQPWCCNGASPAAPGTAMQCSSAARSCEATSVLHWSFASGSRATTLGVVMEHCLRLRCYSAALASGVDSDGRCIAARATSWLLHSSSDGVDDRCIAASAASTPTAASQLWRRCGCCIEPPMGVEDRWIAPPTATPTVVR